jgi:tetratricopeptide (TPR) repeat protein
VSAVPLSLQDLNEVGALCEAGRYAEALKLCGEFVGDHPDHPHGYHLRAVVRVLMGEGRLALADRDKVVSLCPRLPGAYMARAEDQLRLGDFAAACADLDRAEKLDDGHYWPMIPLLRAYCRARLGRFAEAEADCALVPEDYLLTGFGTAVPAQARALRAEIAARKAQAPADGAEGQS